MLHHLTWSSAGRAALFPDEAHRRLALRTLARVAGEETVLFCLVDDHLHLVATEGGPLSRAVLLALRGVAAAELDPAHVRPVKGRSHLEWLVSYLLTQVDKHGLAHHPALSTGSFFADLVGARALFPGLPGRFRAQLPRFRLRQCHNIVGLPQQPLVPADDEAVRTAGPARLVAAAASALAAGPDLSGKAAERVLARRAAACLGAVAGIGTAELAWALGQPARSVRRLQDEVPEASVLTSVRLRLALEEVVAAAI